ncbi:MAG: hypothetical protein MRY64_11620 [Hyphomonadaceae bacterium]|nr:hypothetical protein [Hyphomonadaceae bacterium]
MSVDASLVSHFLPSDGERKLVLKPIFDTVAMTIKGEAAYAALPAQPVATTKSGKFTTLSGWWAQTFEQFATKAASKSYVHLASSKRRIPGYRTFDIVFEKGRRGPAFSFANSAKQKKPLRIEMSMASLRPGDLEFIEKLWSELAGPHIPFRALFPDARITRMDVAIDVLNVRAANLIVHHPKLWKVWCCSDPATGSETYLHYFYHPAKKYPQQSFKKRAQLMIYDKRAERIANDKDPIYGDVPHTRIEISHDPTRFLANLPRWKSNFIDWTIVRAGLDDTELQARSRRTLDSIRARGFDGASALHTSVPASPEDLAAQYPADIIPADLDKQVKEAIHSGAMGLFVEWAKTDIGALLGSKD